MIILIRHAQSEGNKNREIHQTIPDHRVKLTPEGHRQALEAGSKLRALLRPDDTIHFFTSPYRRTRETTEGILESLTSDSPSPSPFPRHTIKVYEEPRLREQDFGNFQPCSAEMERMWLERADYGHFFYRIPNGESAADAYDRVSGFNESLWRLFGENDFASVCVLVTHGLMTRVFLMKWYHWSVEYFEDLRNINHCEFVIMKLNPDNGKYVLQNQLRTWSDLRKEKEMERQHERAAKGLSPAQPATPSETTPVPVRRKWGGCPEGCNHGIRRGNSLRVSRANGSEQPKLHVDTSSPVSRKTSEISQCPDNTTTGHDTSPNTTSQETVTHGEPHMIAAPEPALGDRSRDVRPLERTHPAPSPKYEFHGTQLELAVSSASSETTLPIRTRAIALNETTQISDHPFPSSTRSSPSPSSNAVPRRPDLRHFHRDSEDHLLHPPRSNYAYLHLVGRDGGGSLSGANSLAPSEDERDERHELQHESSQSAPEARSRSASTSNHLYPHQQHHHHHHTQRRDSSRKQSQDLGNDGDDESSNRQSDRPRRTRSHNYHRHPLLSTTGGGRRAIQAKRVANILTQHQFLQPQQHHRGDERDEYLPEQCATCQSDQCQHVHEDTSHTYEPEPESEHEHDEHIDESNDHIVMTPKVEADDLEAQRREDQSIRGSVY
ncbi:acid phosphatase DET1 [Aspergillus saccharolyticus JOP 1030-1]|uniref:Phosphoglycerate mutase-like protein n=1 Tax=Aspergillus saccharolyticus JOP 1030-1 TaxID=1450539 RepID=A0A318Z897_9EURO|nr:phosphoglycerate mutase-like protein [Aspergillus saccharolyticus JOP 1030-1]PYH43545.1 phosphoglycerate mutase-like protein [Aspergillus saccharolyticus JOP 1030-1]